MGAVLISAGSGLLVTPGICGLRSTLRLSPAGIMASFVSLLLLLAPTATSVSVEVSPKGHLLRKQDDVRPSSLNDESSLEDMELAGLASDIVEEAGGQGEDREGADGQEEDEEAQEVGEEDEDDLSFLEEEADIRGAATSSLVTRRRISLPKWSTACAAELGNKSQACATYSTCRRTLESRFELATETKCFDENCYHEFQTKRNAAREREKLCSVNSTSNFYSKERRACYAAFEEEMSTAKAEYTKTCKELGTQIFPKPSDCIMTDECKTATQNYDSCSQQAKRTYIDCMWESANFDDKCAEQKQFEKKTCSLQRSCRNNRRECKDKHRVFENTQCFDEKFYQTYRMELKELFGVCIANATTSKDTTKCWTESSTARNLAKEEYKVECARAGSKPPPACSVKCSRSETCAKATFDVTACLENICTARFRRSGQ